MRVESFRQNGPRSAEVLDGVGGGRRTATGREVFWGVDRSSFQAAILVVSFLKTPQYRRSLARGRPSFSLSVSLFSSGDRSSKQSFKGNTCPKHG